MVEMGETKNYAKFRRELKALCPTMDEREVYKHWWVHQCGKDNEWTIQQTPIFGVDCQYHYLYCTTTPSGMLYIGIHSTSDLEDDYHGSGDEIKDYEAANIELKTTILEFFRTRKEALAMEAFVVNDRFLVEQGVLNKTPGGDDTRHVKDVPVATPTPALPKFPTNVKKVVVDMPFGESVEVPVMGGSTSVATKTMVEAKEASKPTKKTKKQWKSDKWFPFERLEIPKGEKLEYVADNTIVAITLDDIEMIDVNGKVDTLRNMTNELAGRKVGNCLAFWQWRGKTLLEIKKEKLKREKEESQA